MSQPAIDWKRVNHILFVCSGNTCRSPMAAELMRHLLSQDQEGTPVIRSAGIYAASDQPMAEAARQVLEQEGVPAGEHRSRPLQPELLSWADLVLTMTSAQKMQLLVDYPAHQDRVFTLAEAAGQPEQEVRDPFGGSVRTYRRTFQQLKQLLQRVVRQLAP